MITVLRNGGIPNWLQYYMGGMSKSDYVQVVDDPYVQGGFFNWPPPPHAPVHGLAVHEEEGAS